MDFNYCRAFLLIGFLFVTTTANADDDNNKQIIITEARAVYSESGPGEDSIGNEILVVKGHNLCDVKRNRTQIVTLGAKQYSNTLLINDCIKNIDPEKNLDQLEAVVPENLPSATYLLTLNNNVKIVNEDDDEDDEDDDDDEDNDGDSDDKLIAIFDFTYNSSFVDLDVESAARIKGDEVLHELISNETTARITADESEATARKSADEALADDLATEAAARSFSDVILQANIEAEAQTRQLADSAETEARIAADLAETAARKAADAQESAQRLAADLEEALARTAADESHSADIANNALNIDRVDRRVDTLDAFVNKLSTRVDTIALSLEGLETDVQGLGNRIQTNELALKDVYFQLNDLDIGLTTLTEDQQAIRLELNALATTYAAEISNINSELVEIDNTLLNLNGKVIDLGNQLRLQLASIEQNANQIEQQGLKLNTTTLLANTNLLAINTLTSQTDDLKNQLEDQSALLSGIVAQLDIHENRISSLEIYKYEFSNTSEDDIAPGALADFFRSVRVSSSDYIFFEVDTATPTSGAWCSMQADWYVNEYLNGYNTGSTLMSGNWQKWFRNVVGNWTTTTSGYSNRFGRSCGSLIGGWCSEWPIGDKTLGVIPGKTNDQELYASTFGTGTLRIRIAPTRFDACGF